MYETPTSAEEMAAWGFKPSDYAHEETEVWPENESAFDLFRSLGSQWRIGACGPTGLDHNVLLLRLDRMLIEGDVREQIDADVRVMEAEALQVMNEEREQREKAAAAAAASKR